MAFNPPYHQDFNITTGVETFTDKDGKVVTRQEIDDYSAWLEANPPAEPTPSE